MMMTVERVKKQKETMDFQNLIIGQVYENAFGGICLKISHGKEHNCLLWDESAKKWVFGTETPTALTVPLKSKLVILE